MGCVASWPVTVLKRPSHREMALLALPEENRLNSWKEAQKCEDVEVDRSISVASVSCMTTRVTNTPLMMQGSYMCHWNLDKLLLTERLRRKQ